MKSRISSIKSDPVNYLVAATICILFVGNAFILYNLNRGLDWTDESWITVLMSNNQTTFGEPWGFQHVGQPLWQIFGETIVGARVARYFLYQSTVVISAFALYKWAISMGAKPNKQMLLIIGLMAETTMLFAWIYWPRSLGYNELVAFLVTVSVAMVIILASKIRLNQRFTTFEKWMFPLLLGMFSSFALLTKATSGSILAAGVSFFLLLTLRSIGFWALIKYISTVIITTLFAWLLGFPLVNYTKAVLLMITDQTYAASFARPPGLLEFGLRDLANTAVSLFPQFILVLFATALIMGFKTQSNNNLTVNLGTFSLMAASVLVVWNVSNAEGVLGKISNLGLGIGYIALASILVFSWNNEINKPSNLSMKLSLVVAGLAMSLAPLISSIGTNGRLPWHITFNETIWGAAFGLGISLVLISLAKYSAKRFLVACLIPIFAIIAVKGQQVDSLSPYRINNYVSQNQELNSNNPIFSGLKVTKETKETMIWLEENGKSYGDWPVISPAFPGALLTFNGRSFASPWNEDFWPGSFGTIAQQCQQNEKPSKLIVILPSTVSQGTGNYALLENALSNGCGLSFPDQFTLLGDSPADDKGISYSLWKFQK